jgi:hypothetical protein
LAGVISRADADALLVRALGDRRTKMGGAHVAHARRVADAVDPAHGEHVYAAALLHDTVEKGSVTRAELDALVDDERVLQLVDLLTHREGETLEAYLRRCSADPVAAAIKRADLEDKLGPQDVPPLDPALTALLRAEARDKLALLDRLRAE